jgi:hypothetical protein
VFGAFGHAERRSFGTPFGGCTASGCLHPNRSLWLLWGTFRSRS